MPTNRQFSLAYLFLEIFWIAVTLALLRPAYWLHFRYRSFFDGWNSENAQTVFWLLVLAACFTGGTAVGGLFCRMRLGALVVLATLAGMALLVGLWAMLQPSVY